MSRSKRAKYWMLREIAPPHKYYCSGLIQRTNINGFAARYPTRHEALYVASELGLVGYRPEAVR